ncbi:MAG: hypothetical protein Q3972_08080, partial [Corynebacterium sp.]|nr:hypothetical protein [Corynebacterium sp.]
MNTHASGFLGRFCKPVTAVLAGLSLIAGVLHAAPMPAQAAEAYKRNTDILVQANDGNPVHSTVNVALYTVDPSVCTDTKTLENLTEVNGVNSNAKSSVLQDKDYAAGDCVLTKVSYRKNENSGNYRFRISGRDADKDTSGAVGTFVGAYYVGANGDLKRDETALWGSGVPYDNLPATYYEKPKVNERNAAAVDAGNAISTAYGADLYFVRTMPENAPAAAVISWNVTYRELEQTPDGWVDKGNDNTEIPSIIISKPTSTEETS